MFKLLKKLTASNLVTSSGLIMLLVFTNLAPYSFAYASSAVPHQTQSTILTSAEVTAKLALADSKKRQDPALFKKLLVELKNQPSISAEQLHTFNFLTAYDDLYSGQYNKSKSKFKRLLQSNANQLVKFRANYLLVHLATMTRDWQDGLKYIADNVVLSPKINDTESSQNNLLAIIIFYNHLGQHQIALYYIERLAQKNLSSRNACALKQQSLEAKFNLKILKLTSNDFKAAVNTCINAKFLIAANLVHIHKAKLYLQENLPKMALRLLLHNLDGVMATQYPSLIAEMNNVLAKAYLAGNDPANAEKHAKAALKVNDNMSNLLQGVDTYALLYQLAKKQQNLSNALYYLEKYSNAEKAHLEGEKAKHLAFQLAEHNAFEQESQIKLLNEQNNALAAEQALAKIQAANKKLVIVLLSIIILVLAILGTRLWHSHKRVKELAEFDPLTGILNRGHFTQLTQSALKYCQSAEQDLSVIMFDLDHFKKINDSYGHLCGDWALKQVTKACDIIGRKNDIFARLGGEEFCLVLPSCNIDVAIHRAEACRAAIEAIITEQTGCEFTITASFGVTDVKRSGYDLDKLLADSDMAAYASKHAGRNRVTIHQVPDESKVEELDNAWVL